MEAEGSPTQPSGPLNADVDTPMMDLIETVSSREIVEGVYKFVLVVADELNTLAGEENTSSERNDTPSSTVIDGDADAQSVREGVPDVQIQTRIDSSSGLQNDGRQEIRLGDEPGPAASGEKRVGEGDENDGDGDKDGDEDDEEEGSDDEEEESDDEGEEEGDDAGKAGTIEKKQPRTKAMREAARGGKAGNPGRFKGKVLEMLEGLVPDYVRIDKRKGARGKNTRLKEFWHIARSAIWDQFHWTELDYDGLNKQKKVVQAVNRVSITLYYITARISP